MYKIDFNSPSRVYFLGIGGISMSGLAEILKQAGFTVYGSDRKSTAITRALEEKGILVKYGESASHIPADIDCAILTSAVRETNPELCALKERGIPCLTRAELLGQLMKNYATSVAITVRSQASKIMSLAKPYSLIQRVMYSASLGVGALFFPSSFMMV